MDDFWVWCPSVVKGEDGRYHMFASRWPKSLPMHPGWLLASEVVRAVSERPEGPYLFQEVVLPERGAQYWDGRMTHNPRIHFHGGRYFLFHIGTTHPFPDLAPGETLVLTDPRVAVARSNKRIGVAVSDSVFGPWTRFDEPVLKPRPGSFDNFLVSNHSPVFREDGSILMMYKARGYKSKAEDYANDEMTIGIAEAASAFGPFRALTSEPLFSAKRFAVVEDPFLWREGATYHMIAKDMGESLTGEYHGGIHATSPNGLDWTLADPTKAYSRTILWDDGRTETMGSFERPFLFFENGKPTHLFGATADGPGGFHRAARTWNMVIPLK